MTASPAAPSCASAPSDEAGAVGLPPALARALEGMTIEQARAMLAALRREKARRYAKAARRSLLAFCRWVLPGFIPSRFHRHLAGVLERASAAVARGEVARVLLEVPPQHGKTWILTAWMIWHACRYGGPMAYASYSDDRAMQVSRHAQAIVDEVRHEWRAANRPRSATQTVKDWATARSHLRWVGRDGALTGSPAQILVIDDPFKSQAEAWSPTIRGHVLNWYRATTQTRLTPAHAVVVLHTRWHERDLIGELREEAKAGKGWPWQIVSYPAVAEARDDLGREPGDSLFPEYRPREWLDKVRETVGEVVWAALYQQRPTIEEGLVFRRTDFGTRYDHDPQRPATPYGRIVLSIDCNFERGADNDASAATLWGETAAADHLDVLDVAFNESLDFPELVTATLDAINAHRPDAVLIENKANGHALIATLRRSIVEFCRRHKIKIPSVVAFEPGARSKKARAQLALPHWRSGVCRVPESAPWLEALIAQHTGFGAGAAHDDLVDSGTQAVLYLREPEQVESATERARRWAGMF